MDKRLIIFFNVLIFGSFTGLQSNSSLGAQYLNKKSSLKNSLINSHNNLYKVTNYNKIFFSANLNNKKSDKKLDNKSDNKSKESTKENLINNPQKYIDTNYDFNEVISDIITLPIEPIINDIVYSLPSIIILYL